VTATNALPVPYGVDATEVETLAEMRRAVLEAAGSGDALIMAAAVSDFRPAEPAGEKIKRQSGDLILQLVRNEDFLHEVPNRLVKVAFAAETQDVIENARRKPESHGPLDLIVANDVSEEGSGFGTDTNRVTILDAQGGIEELPLMSKYDVAGRILDRVLPLLKQRRT
jgi:phosphopantothenoylcysteine decarboxylase/phosphopantothenate--cysteine ligase